MLNQALALTLLGASVVQEAHAEIPVLTNSPIDPQEYQLKADHLSSPIVSSSEPELEMNVELAEHERRLMACILKKADPEAKVEMGDAQYAVFSFNEGGSTYAVLASNEREELPGKRDYLSIWQLPLGRNEVDHTILMSVADLNLDGNANFHLPGPSGADGNTELARVVPMALNVCDEIPAGQHLDNAVVVH